VAAGEEEAAAAAAAVVRVFHSRFTIGVLWIPASEEGEGEEGGGGEGEEEEEEEEEEAVRHRSKRAGVVPVTARRRRSIFAKLREAGTRGKRDERSPGSRAESGQASQRLHVTKLWAVARRGFGPENG
jgi:hypothetical protein